ncbi:MAG: 2Fe-2S iron-sulfur cluster binding domain-containing protein [Gammaproteobacteria bacterium]|nr:2Fe-2S iron-sulfur cluster binding domain-containing protein [Gammaproteobacteria bacterium]
MFGLFARKGPFDARLSPDGSAITVKAGENLLKAALDAGIAWPHNCRVGSCGQCRSRLVSGKIKELNDFSYVLSKEELDAGMILACQTCLRSDIEVEVSLEAGATMQPARSVTGRIETYRHRTHDIVEIGVRLDQPLAGYLAGQYAEICIPGFVEQPRSYSFASAPGNGDIEEINFFVRLVPGGHMSTWLHETDRTGAQVEVCGPYGNFWLRKTPSPMVLVCGGSGMAPIKALLEEVAQGGFDRDVTLIFGARTQDDLYCLDELEAVRTRANGRFRFVPVLSEEPADSDWQGQRGMCTEFIAGAVADVRACDAYLCGPPGMVDSAIRVLRDHGVDEQNIFYDKFLDASHMQGGRVAAG